jgi:hypothetical protein
VRQLRTRLVAAGELMVQQSRGRHPNVYRIPYEHCTARQGGNPKLELLVEHNPKLGKASGLRPAWIERPKEVKDLKDLKE